MTFTVKLVENKNTVTIGEVDRSENKVEIKITSELVSMAKVAVELSYGHDEKDLLESKNTRVSVVYQLSGNEQTKKMSAVNNSPDGVRILNTGARPISLSGESLFSLGNFLSNTPPGEAQINVSIQASTNSVWSSPTCFTLPVTKKIPEGKTPAKIHYFTVEPDYVLHAGDTTVKLSFYTKGYERMVLFRNNEEVKVWRQSKDGVRGTYEHKPSITSVYRLEGTYTNPELPKENILDTQYRTVHVISPGWNQIALPQGSPVRLFVANDFGGSGADRLYGIFKDEVNYYRLYSSATGVDDWRLEEGDVPQNMATSPGVYYKNKLWLVGGSSVDSAAVSDEVWRYERDAGTERNRWTNICDPKDQTPTWTFPAEMKARMGHACLVFQNELWVLGGYNNGRALNDVWRLKEDKGGFKWECVAEKCAWPARLNHAAVTFRYVKYGEMKNEVRLYGGNSAPQSGALMDMWSTVDGIRWEKIDDEADDEDGAIVPSPGRPLGSALVTYPKIDSSGNNTELDRFFLIGSYREFAVGAANRKLGNRISSFLFERHEGVKFWEVNPVSNGWEQFYGNFFYMQAIAYNSFLFTWSLRSNNDSTLKLNILVP